MSKGGATNAGFCIPLPVPASPWTDISMDFVLGLPRPQRRAGSILVVVENGPLYSMLENHQSFKCRKYPFQGVVGLHGVPRTITS